MESRSIGSPWTAASLACGALLTACGGGGGGSSGPAVTVGFTTAALAAPEGSAAAVEVTLHTAGGGATKQDLTVTIQDQGTGTATPGSDHDFLADQVVTFPAGSLDGDTRSVAVTSVADLAVEGADETLVLRLVDVSGGGLGTKKHTLTIGDLDQAGVAFVGASSATLDEITPHDVELELLLDPGETLAVDVTVKVTDTKTGSGASGVDYATVGSPGFTFPAGSLNQTRRTVTLVPLDDALVEGDETVDLLLVSPSAGASITGGAHEVTITDDEGSGPASLAVSGALFGGVLSPVAPGDDFDLGSAALNSGPNQALQLLVQNTGGQSLYLPPLELSGDVKDVSVALDASALALTAPAFAALPFPFTVVSQAEDTVARGEGASARSAGAPGLVLGLSEGGRASLAQAERAVLTEVPLPGGGQLALDVRRVALPLAPDAAIHVDGRPVETDEVLGDLELWRGGAIGYPESEAFLALSSQGSHGWVALGEGQGTLEMVSEYQDGAPRVHWLWEAQLEAAFPGPVPGTCEAGLPIPTSAAPAGPPTGSLPVLMGTSRCRLAIETDFQFYSKFGNATAAAQYATQLVAAVAEVYREEVQADLEIAYLGIHTTSNDGWSAPETPGATPGTLLNEFQAAWAGSWPASADLAHFISGASLGGGVAYVGALCNQSYGFGVSASIGGNINWGSFTGAPSATNWDFVVVAHELGHNFGALHTHDYCPPLDTCYSNCNGGSSCPQGTLMSYCHVCGGMANLRLRFHPFVAQEMRFGIAGSCLPPAALAPGSSLSLTVSLEPTTGTGGKAAQLDLHHSAPNEGTPFRLDLTGTVTN